MDQDSPGHQPWSRTTLGYMLLLGVVALWTGSSFITNELFTNLDYDKPFLTTYLCTATFSLYLIPYAIRHLSRQWLWQSHNPNSQAKAGSDTERAAYQAVPSNSNTTIHAEMQIGDSDERKAGATEPALTAHETRLLALYFCTIWFAANVTINAALAYTSVSSVTILSSLSGLFTLALGAAVKVERFTLTRILAVVASIIGVILVSQADNLVSPTESGFRFAARLLLRRQSGQTVTTALDSAQMTTPGHPKHPLLGDVLAIASAACYAIYTLLLKAKTGDESRISMTKFFGYVGVWNIVLFWPILLILHFAGLERLQWPKNSNTLTFLIVNAFITFVSDMLMMTSMLMTSPLAVTLGLSLTIPLAVIGDLFLGTAIGGLNFFVGAGLVLGGFIAVGVEDTQRGSETQEIVEQPAL